MATTRDDATRCSKRPRITEPDLADALRALRLENFPLDRDALDQGVLQR